MFYHTKIFILSVFVIFFFTPGHSQPGTVELNPAAAGSYTGPDFTLCWSIGEGVIETFSENNVILTQGFHQPSLKVTLVEESNYPDIQLSVFPNPVIDFLTIDLNSEKNIKCVLELYEISGKLVLRKSLEGKKWTETLDMRNYSSNLYMLRVLDSNRGSLNIFKIQRIN